MKRSFITLLLSALLLFSLSLPCFAGESYDIWVGGTQIETANLTDVLGDGKVSYDAATSTLTLNNAAIAAANISEEKGTMAIRSEVPLTIVLKGSSTITGNAAKEGFGIWAYDTDSNLTIMGDGSLTIKDISTGIIGDGNLNLKSGTLNLTVSDAAITAVNVYAEGSDITVNNSTVALLCGDGPEENVIMVSGGHLDLTGTEKAIYATDDLGLLNNYCDKNGSYILGSVDAEQDFSMGKIVGDKKEIAKHLILVPVTERFKDIENTWYTENVAFNLNFGSMSGTGADTFEPNGTATRAMFISVLYRIDGSKDVTGLTTSFKDVEAGAWYTPAVLWATENKITAGISETEFGVNTPITREQIVALLFKYDQYFFGEDTYDYWAANGAAFTDRSSVSSWAQNAMGWALQNKIIVGADNKLSPQDSATRAQIAAFFERYLLYYYASL